MLAVQYLLSKVLVLVLDGCGALAACVSTQFTKACCESQHERMFISLLWDAARGDDQELVHVATILSATTRRKRHSNNSTKHSPLLQPAAVPSLPMILRAAQTHARYGDAAHPREPPWRRQCPWYTTMHHHLEWGLPSRTGEEKPCLMGAWLRGRGCGPSLSLRGYVVCLFVLLVCIHSHYLHPKLFTPHSMLLPCGILLTCHARTRAQVYTQQCCGRSRDGWRQPHAATKSTLVSVGLWGDMRPPVPV
jgi:hypothetical protein